MEHTKSNKNKFNERVQQRKDKEKERAGLLKPQRGPENGTGKEAPKTPETDIAPPAPAKTLSPSREKIKESRENRKRRTGGFR